MEYVDLPYIVRRSNGTVLARCATYGAAVVLVVEHRAGSFVEGPRGRVLYTTDERPGRNHYLISTHLER